MNNLKKHKILTQLEKVYYLNPHLKKNSILAEISNSLSFNEIQKLTRVNEKVLLKILESLLIEGKIFRSGNIYYKNSKDYKISEDGLRDFYSSFYLSKLWFYKPSNIILIIGILIEICSKLLK